GESGEPGDPAPPGAGARGGSTLSPEEAQAALDAALAELGPEVTEEQARRILELARQTNDLTELTPPDGGGGVPPR
ncbi:MAG: hypothetical protein WD734_01375, partial [Dehalococcoidia bacterium]